MLVQELGVSMKHQKKPRPIDQTFAEPRSLEWVYRYGKHDKTKTEFDSDIYVMPDGRQLSEAEYKKELKQ